MVKKSRIRKRRTSPLKRAFVETYKEQLELGLKPKQAMKETLGLFSMKPSQFSKMLKTTTRGRRRRNPDMDTEIQREFASTFIVGGIITVGVAIGLIFGIPRVKRLFKKKGVSGGMGWSWPWSKKKSTPTPPPPPPPAPLEYVGKLQPGITTSAFGLKKYGTIDFIKGQDVYSVDEAWALFYSLKSRGVANQFGLLDLPRFNVTQPSARMYYRKV